MDLCFFLRGNRRCQSSRTKDRKGKLLDAEMMTEPKHALIFALDRLGVCFVGCK